MPATDLPLPAADFAPRLLNWYDNYGRHDLPWQKAITPYRVWVAEIMLQQTQVATVIPYFERFMTHFPTLPTLAEAELDDVLALWTGLGYYARARNLHKAAVQVMAQHDGKLPDTLDGLCRLAGIGRSTAGAIISSAHNRRAVILDGNVKRVLTRLAAIESPPSSRREKVLWALADRLTPAQRNRDYTQAIMDLGATLCRRGQPACEACPFRDVCLAYKKGMARELPVGKKRKQLPVKQTCMLLIHSHNGMLLKKRPPAGLWGGLWCPLESPDLASIDRILSNHGFTAIQRQEHAAFRHTFSHFHLDITPVIIEVKPGTQIADKQLSWVKSKDVEELGLPAPVKKLLTGELLASF